MNHHPTQTMAREILLIGFGSGIRGDDSLGPRAAELLELRIHDEHVHVLSRPSLTPELAERISGAALVVFIDCAASGKVGEVVRQDIAPRDDPTVSMVHFFDPPALLHWAKLLYGRVPAAVALSVAGESFEVSDDLSPSASDALPRLVDEALAVIAEFQQEAKRNA